MPRIRDWSWTYNTSTTATTIACTLPAYQVGDLLVALCTADTGTTQAWSSTGWTQLVSKSNTANAAILYKIASSSESNPTFTYTIAETVDVRICSIYDYNTTTPFPAFWAGYSYLLTKTARNVGAGGSTGLNAVGQSFISAGENISGVAFYIRKVGNPTGNMTAYLTSHSGTFGTSSVATTTVYATSNTVSASTLTTDYQLVQFTFPTPYQTTVATAYVVYVAYNGDANNYIQVGEDNSSPQHVGNACTRTNTTWSAVSGSDIPFMIRNTKGYGASQSALARVVVDNVMSTVDNTLVLYLNAHSAVGAMTGFVEGPIIQEEAADGSAHSDSLGWTILPKANQPLQQDVYASSLSAAAHQTLMLAIAPPSSGASEVPTYCAREDSIFIDPLNGVTAYNGNTAFAATATSHFGTSLNSRTLSNGTAAAATDVGLMSFHSMAQLTGVTTAGTWAGATLVLATANRPNVSGKNVLCCLKPATPKVYQTLDGIGSTGTCGVAFGMCSTSNTDYRVWHVHGSGTLWSIAGHVPIVINDQATAGMIQNTGTLNATSINAFLFAVSGFTVAPIMQFGPLWVLDTTVIAGGNSNVPVEFIGIEKAIARGKERLSAIVQGSGQLLVLQPIQFGNGGTDPVYLKLENCAIEFPEQYNKSKKSVFYNSVDNVVGITYYAGAGDTIIHRSSVVSSASKFHWRIHASSSASATYDFSGLNIIGAGDVQLRNVTTFEDMSFIGCDTVYQNNSSLKGCSIIGHTSTGLLATDISKIEDCYFEAGTGHAIEITQSGTYNFVGNTFYGYGANNTTSAAIYNSSGGSVTINVSNGDTPTIRNSTGSTTTVNNTVILTLTGLKPNSEVRIYQAGTTTEVGGIENSGTSFQFSYSYVDNYYVDIVVHHLDYLYYRIDNYLLGNTNSTLPVQQVSDRQYLNP